jgi:hypothetical protein
MREFLLGHSKKEGRTGLGGQEISWFQNLEANIMLLD